MKQAIITTILTVFFFFFFFSPFGGIKPAIGGGTSTETTKDRLSGIDISHYQGDEIEFMNRRKDSLAFVICKATEGITGVDPDFSSNWSEINKHGFLKGAYHFYHCGDDPNAQAQHFISVLDTMKQRDLPAIVDFEELGLDGVTDVQAIQNGLLTFLGVIESHYGRVPMIYVDYSMANAYLNNSVFARYHLYIADYNGKSDPDIPQTWKNQKWVLWQKTNTLEINETANDFDEFNGNRDSMRIFLKNN